MPDPKIIADLEQALGDIGIHRTYWWGMLDERGQEAYWEFRKQIRAGLSMEVLDMRNAHVNPVMAQALNAFSPRVPDPSLVALVQSDVPDFLMEQRG